jgi:hypothetical protein
MDQVPSPSPLGHWEVSWHLLSWGPLSSSASNARERERTAIRTVFILTEESVAPGRCPWTSKSLDPLTIPAMTRLYRTLPRSHTVRRAQTTCNTPERTFRTQTSPRLNPYPHLWPVGRKHRKLVPSGSHDTSCIPMWRILYQKMQVRTLSNFRQHTANGGGQRPHPLLDLHFIPITCHLHHHNTQHHTSDHRTSHSDLFFFISFTFYT